MSLLALALTSTLAVPARIEPVLWLEPRGSVRVAGVPVKARLIPGAQTVRTPLGLGLDGNGKRGGLLLEDFPALRLSGSLTISTWVFVRSYPGEQAQLLFRGDDRYARDPYSLCIQAGGTVQFRMDDRDGNSTTLAAEIPLKRWVHITASLDAGTGEIRLWSGDRLVGTRITERRLIADLDNGSTPGVGIGNVQNEKGPHNQPLDGILVDLRLYSAALDPAEAGYRDGIDKRAP